MKKEFRYGNKIKEMRETRGWTQERLAQVAGIETRTVQRVEKDLTSKAETLLDIAGAFEVDLADLRTTWLIPETRPAGTWLVDSHERFVRVEEQHAWHAYHRFVLAPLPTERLRQVEDLLDEIFADRDCLGPDDSEMWRSYVGWIEQPLASLFDLKLAMFVVGERKDLLFKPDGVLKPQKPYMDDWRVQHFLVVPQHGCFRQSPAERLHRFNDNCSAAGDALFHAVTHRDVGLHVFANALVPYSEITNWCDVCFPVLSDGSRISLEYMEQITGLDRDQLYALTEAATGEEDFLNGLAYENRTK
jgi:transcriptional regulator with XRE-family HTH domain